MIRITTLNLFAAALLSLAAPAMAASDHAAEIAACGQAADGSASRSDVDCTVTGSVGNREQPTPKADRYPGGPVSMGSGIWF